MEALRQEEYYTYEEWLELDDDVYAELLDGSLYMMASPSRRHQGMITEFTRQFANFLYGKPCKIYPSPFGVRLAEDTVFLPDITVVCDPSKLNDRGCEGAPDLVVEILSPSTSRYDMCTKFREYLRAGVKEYWIVDPQTDILTVHILKDGSYVTDVYSNTDAAPVKVLPGFEVDLAAVFAE